MAASPFTFFRGAARIMALDLVATPATGIRPQICGDAHLSNFGAYAAPDRSLVFDINDFDETLPGPWEWDLKRLAASLAIAARNNALDLDEQRSMAAQATAAYREGMRELASYSTLDAWYLRVDVDQIIGSIGGHLTKKERKHREKWVEKTRSKDSLHALKKLGETVDGKTRIASQPPDVIPLRDLASDHHPEALRASIERSWLAYLSSVPNHIEALLKRFTVADFAVKVVGVGSVGTRSFIALLQGATADDVLFLQIKEAKRSVLEEVLPDSPYTDPSQRVVEGQRLMQTATDSFLGWATHAESGHHYYWRQLKDMKGSVDVESMSAARLGRYAGLCGWTLARSHARSARASDIAAYLGKSEVFDVALADFAVAYADQNDRDFAEFTDAIRTGNIRAGE